MTIEGLWTVEFRGPTGTGGGVVVLTKNQVLGGDSGYAYIGSYEYNEPNFNAKVTAKHITPGFANVFGMQYNFDLTIQGQMQGNDIVGNGTLTAHPAAKMTVRLKKQSDIK